MRRLIVDEAGKYTSFPRRIVSIVTIHVFRADTSTFDYRYTCNLFTFTNSIILDMTVDNFFSRDEREVSPPLHGIHPLNMLKYP